jgi:hypothetical protein
MAPAFISLVGRTFGLLEILEHVGFNENRQALYRAKCLCGKELQVRGTDLTAGGEKQRRKCGPDCPYQPPRTRFTHTTISNRGETTTFSK